MSEKSPPRTDLRGRPAKNFGGIFCRIDEKRYLCKRNGSPCGRHRRSGDEKGNGWKSRTVPAVVSSSAAWRTQAQALSTTDRRIGKVLRSERVRRPAVAAHARELTCGERGSRVERNQFNDSNRGRADVSACRSSHGVRLPHPAPLRAATRSARARSHIIKP